MVKIYTKTGDSGQTSLYGGARVPKYATQVSAYGTIDELNSVIGIVVVHSDSDEVKQLLREIQGNLLTIGAYLAGFHKEDLEKIPLHTTTLEKTIDDMDASLNPLRNFTLPGGSAAAAYAGFARTVTRRAERLIVQLATEMTIDKSILQYLNRLSDYFFVLARFFNHRQGVKDIIWKQQTKTK